MPNIFKRFLQPNASDFVFPDVEELVEEEPADTAGEQEGEPEESAPEAEEKDTPSAVDFAQIQAEKILEAICHLPVSRNQEYNSASFANLWIYTVL